MLARVFTTTLFIFASSFSSRADGNGGPPEEAVGERLFLETRFSQFFAAHSAGDANASLAAGDPVMETTVTVGNPQPGPFAGQSMNCRACHLVDEHKAALGDRTYADFARRSPVPDRGDGQLVTPRNSPALVNALTPRASGMFLHFDGQFASARDLVIGTFTGRNFGWLSAERKQAIAHIAHIIRDDDGTGVLANSSGGAYRILLEGTSISVPMELRLPPAFRIDVMQASDEQILLAVGNLVTAYLKTLQFSQTASGVFTGSPYDLFLGKNKLPRTPLAGETPIDYARRLRAAINGISAPKFVSNTDRQFHVHQQEFVFGVNELAGLKIFLREPPATGLTAARAATGGFGNCIACHAPPDFTDFKFHNTGATQEEYDSLHGAGGFARLVIPTLALRRENPDAYLPATPLHPFAAGSFLGVPDAAHPERVDLGLWNVFANPDFPRPQARLLLALDPTLTTVAARLLPLTVARFKTPGLRDLADSAPYLHTGRMDTIEDVIGFYRVFSGMSRLHQVRNVDPEIPRIALAPNDTSALAAFLRALTEDYE